ncbi:MAG: Hpt domain-containing protein, partial [Bacteroidetes bacterium]|nr:Hpt domain-containing protein [Bacteroidota bacterium]
GMNDHISKPINADILYSKIVRLCDLDVPAETSKSLEEVKSKAPQGMYKIIDLSFLEEQSMGNKDYILRMINYFIEQTPQALDDIKIKLNEGDMETVGALVHKIKPTTQYYGLSDMEKKLQFIEDIAYNGGEKEKIEPMLDEIVAECEMALKELNKEKERLEQSGS